MSNPESNREFAADLAMLDYCLDALHSEEWVDRRSACQKLGQLRFPVSRPALADVVNNDANPEVREAARAALDELEKHHLPLAVATAKRLPRLESPWFTLLHSISSWVTFPRAAFGIAMVLILTGLSYFYVFHTVTKVNDRFITGLSRHGNLIYRSSVTPIPKDLVPFVVAEINASDSDWAKRQALQQIVSPLPPEPVLGTNHTPSNHIVLLSPMFASSGSLPVAVRSLPVTFRWQLLNGASEYTVVLRNTITGVVLRRTSTSNKLQWDDGIDTGAVYQWQVTATVLNENVESPPSLFRLLSASDQSALAPLESQFRESPLILAAIYRKFGLVQENEQEHAKFIQANPGLKTTNAH